MKILWVKAGGLLPLDTGGKIRSYHILKHLAARHEITFYTFYGAMPSDPHHELNQLFTQAVCLPLAITTGRGIAELLNYSRHVFSALPYSMAKYHNPEITQKLRAILKRTKFDVIVCDFIFAAGAIPWNWPCPKVLFAHNAETLIWKRHCNLTSTPHWKLAYWSEYRRMERAERSFARLADSVMTVSDIDRTFFGRFIDPRKISVIPTGVDVDYFRPGPWDQGSNSLLFTGSMDWMPNEDAIFFFVDRILPLIRSQVPGVRLHVVGRKPSKRLRDLPERESAIEVTGTVEDIRPYFRNASVYVVPLRVGGGTRLKIFEAMAMGKAVVSTSIGAEGLPIQHGENILLADDPIVFANQVVKLLRCPSVRTGLGRAARLLVEQNHNWDSVGSYFESALNGIAGKIACMPLGSC